MNKAELIVAIADKTGLSKKDAEKALAAGIDSIFEALRAGEKVQIMGFGTFEAKMRAAREGINPRTGEPIQIAAAKVPSFKAGKGFKDAL